MKKKTKQDSVPPFSAERFVPIALVIITAVLFVIRITGPANLMDNDQERPAAYTLDATVNHHWVCQQDEQGDITSKPPLYTWLAAISTLTLGHGTISLVTLYLPCFLAVLGTALILFRAGGILFGWQAAALGALMFIISPQGMKQIALARTDPLFAFTVTLTALAGYCAWSRGKGWVWFWLAATLSGLTKGPLGLLLAAGGFACYFWNRKTALKQPALSWKALPGILLFLGLVGGWFFLAYQAEGQALYNKMIKSELVNHAVGSHYGSIGAGLLKTPAYLLSRFLPWSLLGIWACVQVFRKPAQNEDERRLERFLVCWIIVGCIILGLGTHQRGDLILPLIPPLSLLAGRLVWRWLPQKLTSEPIRFLRTLILLGAVGLSVILCYNRFVFSKQEVTAQTKALELAASNIKEVGYNLQELHHYQTPFTLQFYLNTMTPATTQEELIPLLRSGKPALLTVRNIEELEKSVQETLPPYRVVYKWYLDEQPFLFLLANEAWSASASTLNTHTRKLRTETLYKN